MSYISCRHKFWLIESLLILIHLIHPVAASERSSARRPSPLQIPDRRVDDTFILRRDPHTGREAMLYSPLRPRTALLPENTPLLVPRRLPERRPSSISDQERHTPAPQDDNRSNNNPIIHNDPHIESNPVFNPTVNSNPVIHNNPQMNPRADPTINNSPVIHNNPRIHPQVNPVFNNSPSCDHFSKRQTIFPPFLSPSSVDQPTVSFGLSSSPRTGEVIVGAGMTFPIGESKSGSIIELNKIQQRYIRQSLRMEEKKNCLQTIQELTLLVKKGQKKLQPLLDKEIKKLERLE